MDAEDDPHIEENTLERYALGQATGADLAATEEHLLVCERCRRRLAELEEFIAAFRGAVHGLASRPLDFTHHTELGPIRLRSLRERGRWMARVSGRDIEYGREFDEVADANRFLLDGFRELFAGHRCTDQCGPTRR